MKRRLVIEIESRGRYCDQCKWLGIQECLLFGPMLEPGPSYEGWKRIPACMEAERLGQLLIPQDLGPPDTVCRRKP